jgi:hypothetical protein
MLSSRINIGACLVYAGSEFTAAMVWLFGQAPLSEIPSAVASQAGITAICGLIGSAIGLIVNRHYTDRKEARDAATRLEDRKLENDQRIHALQISTVEQLAASRIEALNAVATALSTADQKVLAAKAEADAVIATLNAQLKAGRVSGRRRDVRIDDLSKPKVPVPARAKPGPKPKPKKSPTAS